MMIRKNIVSVFTVCLSLVLSNGTSWSVKPDTPGPPEKPPGSARTVGTEQDEAGDSTIGKIRTKRPGSRSGLIKTNHHVFYVGDTLTLSIVLPCSLQGFWNGDAEAHLVLQGANGTMIAVALDGSALEPDKPTILAENISLGADGFPAGIYQIAIILTEPGGDPLNLEDWYGGLYGLVSISRIKFTEQEDAEDVDADGNIDGDSDGDGYGDEDENA